MKTAPLLAFLFLSAAALVHCSSSTTAADAGVTTDAATPTPDAAPPSDASTPDTAIPDSAVVDAAKPPACQSLPAGATIEPGSTPCTTTAGLYTAYTVNATRNTYFMTCDVPEADLYKDQADFDKNEGTSTVAGITVKSNADYVRATDCASGSIQYTAPPESEVKLLFLWTKQK